MQYDAQRALALKLISGMDGLAKTRAFLTDKTMCFSEILAVARKEIGVAALTSLICERGLSEWAYCALRDIRDLGTHRDALIRKAGEEPRWAYYTLHYVQDLGTHRDVLIRKVSEEPRWAHYTLLDVRDLGAHRSMLERAVAKH